ILPEVLVRIIIKPENTITLGLYKLIGFIDSAVYTLEEALRVNNNIDFIPSRPLRERFMTRLGLVLALKMNRND
ncbi:uncharacterized protein F5Z01DRAFT_595982, partial [Emericellopsis atlantica]